MFTLRAAVLPLLVWAVFSGASTSWAQIQSVLDCESALSVQLTPLELRPSYKNENRRGIARLFLGQGVPYFSNTEQQKYEVFILNGLIVDSKGLPVSRAGMYVLSETGSLIVRSSDYRYHHSSLAKGLKIWCAGEIIIRDGIIAHLNFSSGHYWPTKEHFVEFVALLLKKGVLLPRYAIWEKLADLVEQKYDLSFPEVVTE